jgi:CRISPR-associated protein Cst2
MRAPGGKGKEIAEKRGQWATAGLSDQDTEGSGDKLKFSALTRSSPLKMSTVISIGPLKSRDVGSDFGTMTRFEGDPVPFAHEFYRTTLMGLFSIDLRMLGRFYHIDRTGYRHLDKVRTELAQKQNLTSTDDGKAFELPLEERKKRLAHVLQGFCALNGGAKQAIHFTDVSPRLLLLAAAKGGNHLFSTAIGADKEGLPVINTAALEEVASVFKSDLLSGFFAGVAKGYLDDQRNGLQKALDGIPNSPKLAHPVETVRSFVTELNQKAEEWLA